MDARLTIEGFADSSVAFIQDIDQQLAAHLVKGSRQEDLTFAFWRPSRGGKRFTAILHTIVLPGSGDRELHGNVAFTEQYIRRVLVNRPIDSGVALLHSHLGPGWQGMSHDDIVAERDRLAGAVWGRSQLPLLGLTRGTDGSWSARHWIRTGAGEYGRKDAATVRVVGDQLRITYHPRLRPAPEVQASQVATASVWGARAQAQIARARIGVVGLGSVGSIVAEALSRTGFGAVTLIDHDVIEERNLDRTLGAEGNDVANKVHKVHVSERLLHKSHTSAAFDLNIHPVSLLTREGWNAAMDCDAIVCCVDKPWPRALLNMLAYAHLIPIVDGGIFARVKSDGTPLHVDWRIHRIGPGRGCLYCSGALLRSDASLDKEGLLDDPDYIAGLTPEEKDRLARRNVFSFSLSVAAHEVLQLVGMITGMPRIGGLAPQMYHAFPGRMDILPLTNCVPECEIAGITAEAIDLTDHFLRESASSE